MYFIEVEMKMDKNELIKYDFIDKTHILMSLGLTKTQVKGGE
jgi:hypothetical protein